MTDQNNRVALLGQIRNPLVFFALALLLIEGIIGLVVATSHLTESYTFYSVCIMAFLFLVVVGVVTVITIKWPRHLYEEIAEELEFSRVLRNYIESTAFRDTIEDIMCQSIKPECIKETEQSDKEEQ